MCEPRIAIKGGADDSVVLCTSDRTYDIRSVTLSNNVLVVCPPPNGDGNSDQVVIQDSLNELLELVPTVPRLHRLKSLLKEYEWEEGHEEEDDNLGAVRVVYFLARVLPWTQGGPSSRSASDSRSTKLERNFRPASRNSRKHSERSTSSS
jgi:hypothetical protein